MAAVSSVSTVKFIFNRAVIVTCGNEDEIKHSREEEDEEEERKIVTTTKRKKKNDEEVITQVLSKLKFRVQKSSHVCVSRK